MKTALTITFMLIGIVSWGQFAKVSYVEQFLYYEDYFCQSYYEYDSESNLKSIEYYENGVYVSTSNYENDTLVNEYWPDGYSYYVYNIDSVYRWWAHSSDSLVRRIFQLDSLGQVYVEYSPERFDRYEYHEWENGNCTKVHSDLGSVIYTDSLIYYSDYLNPFYTQNESIRRGSASLFRNGSVNLLHERYHTIGSYTEYRVLESIGPYPTLIDYGDLYDKDYIIIEYFEVSNDIPETHAESHTVIQTDYYDIMGRKIKKPTKGFYIERKTTDKGVISKKYFIQ
jgi:hypothetical protein